MSSTENVGWGILSVLGFGVIETTGQVKPSKPMMEGVDLTNSSQKEKNVGNGWDKDKFRSNGKAIDRAKFDINYIPWSISRQIS